MSSISPITTHVLDLAHGTPAVGIEVTLEKMQTPGQWKALGKGLTDSDGRLKTLLAGGATADAGTYRLNFETGQYFGRKNQTTFFPVVQIVFELKKTENHVHVPLLLSPFGYQTYRGT